MVRERPHTLVVLVGCMKRNPVVDQEIHELVVKKNVFSLQAFDVEHVARHEVK
jgi:hypothetical protein